MKTAIQNAIPALLAIRQQLERVVDECADQETTNEVFLALAALEQVGAQLDGSLDVPMGFARCKGAA